MARLAPRRSLVAHALDVLGEGRPRCSRRTPLAAGGIEAAVVVSVALLADCPELAAVVRRGDTHAMLGDHRALRDDVRGAIALAPATRRGDQLGAIDRLRAAAEMAPLDAEIHFRLGCSLWLVSDVAAGMNELEISVQLDPDWDRARVPPEAGASPQLHWAGLGVPQTSGCGTPASCYVGAPPKFDTCGAPPARRTRLPPPICWTWNTTWP